MILVEVSTGLQNPNILHLDSYNWEIGKYILNFGKCLLIFELDVDYMAQNNPYSFISDMSILKYS